MPRKRSNWGHRVSKRALNLEERYGLSEDAYNALLEAQRFQCKICGKRYSDKLRKNLSVDHDHKTNNVRGLLCGNCNRLLGLCDENPVILLKAIHYLKGNL